MITDEDLIVKQEVSFGESSEDMGNGYFLIDKSTQQTITISKDEISEFNIINQSSKSKGSYQIYEFSCILIKPHATLNISEISADGIIAGVYSYTPSVTNQVSEPGRSNVSSKIDMSTLFMELTSGDWVNRPSNPFYTTKCDINAILY